VLFALSVSIPVVLMATPPEETRNWADADKVVRNAVPPEKRFRGRHRPIA
jgi:hypothetical protein